ncbi:MAG: hypothetical protein RI562_03130 [Salibacter sp.]|uniref:OmpL47-type beta-barrel domain-containing protein n=1 Tax=Salibacter sp. TaxID=2010995 RepID=UPI0028708D8D|nr:hypothetical protein [Salibacter sp.]MDR9398029.1 hypothetical protein [Salibacter sp.]
MNIKGILLGAAGLVISASLFAQSEPNKPSYENVVYQANGNYYIQKSLPLYLKFSTTPDGKNYPLKSKSHPSDANPLYLDTEGINYIRSKWAVDPETGDPVRPQREVLMEVYADGISPRTTLRFSGAPKYVKGGTVYYGKGLNFSLSSRDGVSGVKETQYALGGGYSKYSNEVAVNNEGAQTLYYYSADNVGNAEDTRSSDFTVDLSAPSSSHSIDGITHNENILAPSTVFNLSSSDNLAGVKVTRYSFDNGSDRNYPGRITMAGLKDGNHTLYYYAEDNVDNTATKKSFKFYLDRIAPEVNSKVVGDQYKGKYLYVSPRTKVNLTASDNKAGVKNIYYRIDGGNRNTFSSDFNIPNKLGTHSVKYDANDNVENLSTNHYLNVYMDNKSPETGIKYGNPQFFDRDTLFITSETEVTLFKSDVGSGVKSTKYSIDGGGEKDYSTFTIPGEGYHTTAFYSTDNVNNKESKKTSNVFVDNTAPDIFVNFSIDPIGKKGDKNIYPNYVRMYVGATDKHTGTKQLFYSIDGEPLRQYSSPQTLDISELSRFRKKKKYEVKVVARDMLGNESEETFEFYVGRQD